MTEWAPPSRKLSLRDLPLLLALALLPLFDGGLDHQVIYWVVLLLLGGCLALALREGWGALWHNRYPFFLYLLFVLWGGVSIFWSLNPHRTLMEFLQLSSYGLVFLLVSRLDEENIFRLGRIALITGTGIAIFAISQYLFLSPDRVSGTFLNPNPLAIYLVMLFLAGWGYFLRRPDAWAAGGSLLLLTALWLSGSRGGLIALLLALPFIFWGSTKRELGKRVMQTGLILLLTFALTQAIMFLAPLIKDAVGSPQLLTYFLSRPDSFIATSGVGRVAFWEVAARLALQEPVKGYGLGSFYIAYHLGYPGDVWFSRFAHNHYMQTVAELGVIGIALLAAYLLLTMLKVWQGLRCQSYSAILPGIFAAMLAFLLHIGVDFSWNFPGAAVIFFAMAGGAAAVYVPYRGEIKTPLFKVLAAALLVIIFFLTAWQYTGLLLYRQGLRLDAAGDASGALKAYSRALTVYPIYSMFHFHAAMRFYQAGLSRHAPHHLEETLAMMERAVRFSPADSELHNRLGSFYEHAGNLAEAEKHLSLAVKYAGYRIGMYQDLASFYFRQERLTEAEVVSRQALELANVALKRAELHGEAHLKEDLYDLYLLLIDLHRSTGRDIEAEYYADRAAALYTVNVSE